jgi:hypothetical protein
MGPSYSYLNVWSMSTIVTATPEALEDLICAHENAYREKNPVSIDPDAQSEAALLPAPVNYTISEAAFLRLLHDKGFTASDTDILLNLFRLIDTRGFREIDIRDALVSIAVITARSVHECFELSMKLTEREGNQIIDKHQLIHIFKLMNATCHYFGDKYLQMDQVQDLADSLYTSIGRIDGTIFYPHYLEYITTHPIIEMFLSPQFQGGMKDKLLSDEQIDAMMDKQ